MQLHIAQLPPQHHHSNGQHCFCPSPSALLQIRSHKFNIFDLAKASKKPLKALVLAAVDAFDLTSQLQLPRDKLESLAEDLQDSYNSNSYHGAVHAADMTQMAACILHKDGLGAALSPLLLFAVLLAAAGHDAAHCGELPLLPQTHCLLHLALLARRLPVEC
jgi:hypothetical protein